MGSTSQAEIIGLEHAYWKAVQARDVEAARRLTDETCIVTGAQGFAPIDWKVFAATMNSDTWALHRYELIGDPLVHFVSGDCAVVAYKIRRQLTVDGKPVSIEAADSSAWVRRDGTWRCVLHTEALLGDPFGRDRITRAGPPEGLAEQQAVANLAVSDLGVARRFYEETVGLTPVHQQGEELVVYKSGASTVNVYRSRYAGTNQATAVTWNVGDIEGAVRDLREKGVRFEHYDLPAMKREGDIHVGQGVKVAWFRDPDGNILNLVSP